MDFNKLAGKVGVLIAKYGNVYALKKVDNSSAGRVQAVLDEQVKRDANGIVSVRKVMFIAGNSKTKPDVGMFMESEKQTYRIESVENVAPAGKSLLFEVVVGV